MPPDGDFDEDANSITLVVPGADVEEEEPEDVALDGDTFLLDTLLDSEQLGPAIKAIFESGGSKEKEMIARLTELAAAKKRDVQDICNFHHQDFISAVDELLELRTETAQLRSSLLDLDKKLQSSGQDLLTKSREMLTLVKTLENIRKTKYQLKACLAALKETEHVQTAMDSKAVLETSAQCNAILTAGQLPIGALRQLKELKETNISGLAHRSNGFEWAKYYDRDVIPHYQSKIRTEAGERFGEWLVRARDASPVIGAWALAQAAGTGEQENRGPMNALLGQSGNQTQRQRLKHFQQALPKNLQRKDLTKAQLFHAVKLDFTAVYQNIHIHGMLNMRDQFLSYYKENRRMQCDLALQLDNSLFSSSSETKSLREQFEQYFQQVTGFFFTEAHVFNTTTDFMARSEMDDLFFFAVQKVSTVVKEVVELHGSQDLTHLVDAVSLFARAMEKFEYDVNSIHRLLSEISQKCSEAALRTAHDAFVQVLGAGKYEPLRIKPSDKKFKELISANGLEQYDLLAEDNVMVFPFSAAVPMVSLEAQSYINAVNGFTQFCKHPEEQLVQQVALLVQQLNNCIALNMEESYSHSNVAQLVQIYQNITFFCKTAMGLDFALRRLGYSASTVRRAATPVRQTLEKSKRLAEEMLVKLMKRKVDLFLAMAEEDLDWLPKKPLKVAHEHVQDLAIYLEALYQMMNPLNAKLQKELLGLVHLHICQAFEQQLCSDSVRFNLNYVLCLQQDIIFLVGSAKKLGVDDAGNPFSSLAQIIDLLMDPSPECYLDEARRQQDFELIDPAVLINILPRYHPNNQPQTTKVSEQSLSRLQQGLAQQKSRGGKAAKGGRRGDKLKH